MKCSAVNYSTVQCSIVQLVTVQSSEVQCSAADPRPGVREVAAVGRPGGPVDTEVTGGR